MPWMLSTGLLTMGAILTGEQEGSQEAYRAPHLLWGHRVAMRAA